MFVYVNYIWRLKEEKSWSGYWCRPLCAAFGLLLVCVSRRHDIGQYFTQGTLINVWRRHYFRVHSKSEQSHGLIRGSWRWRVVRGKGGQGHVGKITSCLSKQLLLERKLKVGWSQCGVHSHTGQTVASSRFRNLFVCHIFQFRGFTS